MKKSTLLTIATLVALSAPAHALLPETNSENTDLVVVDDPKDVFRVFHQAYATSQMLKSAYSRKSEGSFPVKGTFEDCQRIGTAFGRSYNHMSDDTVHVSCLNTETGIMSPVFHRDY